MSMKLVFAVLALAVCASCGEERPEAGGRSRVSGTTSTSTSTSTSAAAAPGVVVTPSAQSTGGTVSVDVVGHCADLRIAVYLETEVGTPDSPILGEATTTASGSATLDVVIPSGTEAGRYRLGTFYVDAPDECRNRKAAVPFDVR